MKPSITYLHLLAKTPFFIKLTRAQLKWVIDHSKEWDVTQGTLITSSDGDPNSIWVLLDGGWQIETGSTKYAIGHGDPGNWYGGPAVHAASAASRLVASEPSYVMEMRMADFDDMVKRGFDFNQDLRMGVQFYLDVLKV
jgi:hypothetical protein